MNVVYTEKGSFKGGEDNYDNSDPEAAAAKLWAVYVSEAEKYDKGLVESWKSDMEGMLIFAGLFSASLTAFLIESYKTLIPDSGDTTILFLSQISQQLAASSNGTIITLAPLVQFQPSSSSLVCNILWFISLGLSLTCALVATLLEQWARDFLHKADMRSAPVIRARVFSYLYYGLKTFRMHTVVEIIPLLLHASLLFFFAGLVAFLIRVNIVVTAVAAAILVTVILVYATLTLLPLFHSACPYRTPLSGGFWRARNFLQTILQRRPHSSWTGSPAETMVDEVFSEATAPSKERQARDEKALVWTLKSLTDDVELEPLLDAIPDLLLGRPFYDGHIRCLTDNPEAALLRRVQDFQHSCFSGILGFEAAKRRQISCYKAIWALGSLSTAGDGVRVPVLYIAQLDPEVLPYYSSARASQTWANFCAAKSVIDETMRHLITLKDGVAAKQPPNAQVITEIRFCLKDLGSTMGFSFDTSESWGSSTIFAAQTLQPAVEDLANEIAGLRLRILLDYLGEAHGYEAKIIPYRFQETQSLMAPPAAPLSGASLREVEIHLDRIVYHNLERFKEAEDLVWLDDVFCKIVSYWDPQELDGALPWAVVEYLNSRKSENAVQQAFSWIPPRAWKHIPDTIRLGPATSSWRFEHLEEPNDVHKMLSASLTAVWRLCWEYPRLPQEMGPSESIDLTTWEDILDAVAQQGTLDVVVEQTELRSIISSVIAMVKSAVWRWLNLEIETLTTVEIISRWNHRILPAAPFVPLPEDVQEQQQTRLRTSLRQRYAEGELNTATEFIQQCCSNNSPFKGPRTLMLAGRAIPTVAIDPVHQLHFANALKELFEVDIATRERELLLKSVPNMALWQIYAPTHIFGLGVTNAYPWLDNPQARRIVQATFETYLTKIPVKTRLYAQVQEILAQLDALHTVDTNET
ncbi:hypothetical protein B0H16DRAFT_1370531 [Mycena metata]|uniref:DUF6535 domain-containing protein n=1 Tax=Mycena metata TaxID=1033252 RepID=A0AAD7J9D5_9AGAR|nr:hypothetical protein B0H16DRAFT_1370531 [Mycena metata]